MKWADSAQFTSTNPPSNAQGGRSSGFVPPIRMHEVLQGNARNHKVLVHMPWLPSNIEENTEWQVCSGRIGGDLTDVSRRAARRFAEHDAQVAIVIEAIEAWTKTGTDEVWRVRPTALRRRFNIRHVLHGAVDRALECAPWATADRRRDGVVTAWSFMPRGRAAQPLRALVTGLPDAEGAAGPKGRRSADGRAQLTGLTNAQREAAMAVVTLIERGGAAVGLDASDGPTVLATADFPALVARLSDAAAAEKARARGTRWSPETNSMRPKLVSAATNLRHLAATYGLSAVRAPADTLPMAIAPELRPLFVTLRRKLDARTQHAGLHSGTKLRVTVGLRVLGRLLTRRGWHAPAQVDTDQLRSDVLDACRRGLLSESHLAAVRFVWLRLHTLYGTAPLASRRPEAALFSDALVTQAINARPTVCAVVLPSESPYILEQGPTLLDGAYGLRRVLEFLTVSPDVLGARPDLPGTRFGVKAVRRYADVRSTEAMLALFRAPGDEIRDAAPLADATVKGYAMYVRRVAQALHRRGELDVSIAACLTVATVTTVAAAEGWITTDDRSTRTLSSHGYEIIEALLAVAWAAAQLATHDGDEPVARAFLDHRQLLWKWRRKLSKSQSGDDIHAQKLKQVVEIDRIWRGTDHVAGYVKLGFVRDCIIGRIEHRAGCRLDEQVTWLYQHRGAAWASISWAIAVRNAALVHFLRYAPLRSRELVRVTRTMLRASRHGVPCDVWTPDATVEICVPAAIMKSNRPREGTFASESDAPDQEARFIRALWALLLMPGGACDILGGQRGELFPSSGASSQLYAASLSMAFRSEVTRYADRLGIDVHALRASYGASGLHAIRALVGRYLAHDLGNVTQAMVMLHHASVEFTVKRYVGNTARTTRMIMPN